METYYLVLVGVLFALAISDLIVGVSNDAVNFLNSAIGSKAASFNVIILIAAVGVLVGATFSSGMMEVARKGIFHPDQFGFDEIMVLFLAVMLTDILLLDFFNTIGLPTSTTVSIVFELLGASVAIATYKIIRSGEGMASIGNYINSESAMLIIAGIFLSIIIAFTVGLLIQALVRFAFSFNIEKTMKYWGGIWGGLSTTTIMYFLLIKGAKGSAIVTDSMLLYIKEHTGLIILISAVSLTGIFQLLVMFTRVNVNKVIVLMGTFALAMAFAGNDLVNFIGVPLAGFASFKAFMASGLSEPSELLMTSLKEPVATPLVFLILAGLIMVVTLRLSKKARSVTATTINLSRQGEGHERFESIGLARLIVRNTVEISNFFSRITPKKFRDFKATRFDSEEANKRNSERKMAFDLIRASVNLVVASILIAIGTSLKLPLSTTYVTFMVAMGTSLADGAWGRESAVYRITGVVTVIGGWFFTAFIAFTASFLMATIIFYGKFPVIVVLVALSIFIIYRTQIAHKNRVNKDEKRESLQVTMAQQVLDSCKTEVRGAVVQVSKLLFLTYVNFAKEKLKELKSIRKQSKKLNKAIKQIKTDLPETLKKFDEHQIMSGHYYVQVIDHLKETSNSLYHIVAPAYKHIDNNHPLDHEQSAELKNFNEEMNEFFNYVLSIIHNNDLFKEDELTKRRDELIDTINKIIRNRIKILKKKQKGTKVSITYIDMLTETKNLALHTVELVKSNYRMLSSLSEKDSPA
jgi:phosphate/sulfate permease